MPTACITWSRDHKVTSWNPAAERMFGYTAAEALGRSPGDFLVPSKARELVNGIGRRLLEGKADLHTVNQNQTKDGRRILCDWTSTPLRGSDGSIIGVLSMIQDVTERNRSDRRLAAFAALGQRLGAAQTTKEAARIIVEVADDLLGWDACWCDLYSSGADLVRLVLSMDIVNGQRAECVLTGTESKPGAYTRKALQEGGQLILREQPELAHPDLRPFGDARRPSASLMFVPMRNGNEITGMLSIQSYTPQAYDQESLQTLQALADHCGGMFAHIRTEEALQASECFARSLVESLPQNILRKDLAGRFTFANELFCRTAGKSSRADHRQDRRRPLPAPVGGQVPPRR